MKLQIKSLLAIGGSVLPDPKETPRWSGAFIAWLEGLFDDRPSMKEALTIYLDELKWHRTRLASLLRQLRELSRNERFAANVALLLTVPGVGLITAMVILTELIDIGRFRMFDYLASYVGLVPDTAGSGDAEHTTGITKRGNAVLRPTLIECSWSAIRCDPELAAKFKRDAQRMAGSKAIVRTAHKLLSRIHHVLRQQQPYRVNASTTSMTQS